MYVCSVAQATDVGIPTFMNATPHSREMRRFFYNDISKSVIAGLNNKQPRMRARLTIPELNPEMDVYRCGPHLLEHHRSHCQECMHTGNSPWDIHLSTPEISMSYNVPNLSQEIHLHGRETVCLQSAYVFNPVFLKASCLCVGYKITASTLTLAYPSYMGFRPNINNPKGAIVPVYMSCSKWMSCPKWRPCQVFLNVQVISSEQHP